MKAIKIYILTLILFSLTMCTKPQNITESCYIVEYNNIDYKFPNYESDDLIEAMLDNKVSILICIPPDNSQDDIVEFAALTIRHTLQGDGNYRIIEHNSFSEYNLNEKLIGIEASITINGSDGIYYSSPEHQTKINLKKEGDKYSVSSEEGIVLKKADEDGIDTVDLPSTIKIKLINIYPLRNIVF